MEKYEKFLTTNLKEKIETKPEINEINRFEAKAQHPPKQFVSKWYWEQSPEEKQIKGQILFADTTSPY